MRTPKSGESGAYGDYRLIECEASSDIIVHAAVTVRCAPAARASDLSETPESNHEWFDVLGKHENGRNVRAGGS